MAEKKPGMMFYFRWRTALQQLSHEQVGQLLLAAMLYSETGQLPRFRNKLLTFAWNAIRPDVDADAARYDRIVATRRSAAAQRWSRQAERPAADMDAVLNAYMDRMTMPPAGSAETGGE